MPPLLVHKFLDSAFKALNCVMFVCFPNLRPYTILCQKHRSGGLKATVACSSLIFQICHQSFKLCQMLHLCAFLTKDPVPYCGHWTPDTGRTDGHRKDTGILYLWWGDDNKNIITMPCFVLDANLKGRVHLPYISPYSYYNNYHKYITWIY